VVTTRQCRGLASHDLGCRNDRQLSCKNRYPALMAASFSRANASSCGGHFYKQMLMSRRCGWATLMSYPARSDARRSRRMCSTDHPPARPGSHYVCQMSPTDNSRERCGQGTVATHHRDGHHASSGSPPPPLPLLQPSRAFRLTRSATWSTDTSSRPSMSVARIETFARTPQPLHGRAGGRTHALPELWL
jgi:hypothetical protein